MEKSMHARDKLMTDKRLTGGKKSMHARDKPMTDKRLTGANKKHACA